MFERFTDPARQVVVLAQDEARELKHNYIGTEHLLLGLLRERDGLGARVLVSLGVQFDGVREQIGRIVGQGDTIEIGQIPFTPRAKRVLELSLREALSLGHNYIGTEHLLLGLAREADGLACRILFDFGVTAERAREAVIAALSGTGQRVELYGPSAARLPRLPRRGPRHSASFGEPFTRSATTMLVAGWLLFGAALGVGILIGWAIWG